MPFANHAATAHRLTRPQLWAQLERHTAESFDLNRRWGNNPERRWRASWIHALVIELRQRGDEIPLLDPSEGRASRNAILGWED